MKNQVIELSKHYKVQGGTLTVYAADYPFDEPCIDWRRPAVVIVPGGGYSMCSKREGETVGFKFLAKGFNAFVLEYMCEPDGVYYPEQLLELAVSVDYIRKNAEKFNTNPDEIFAVGFSAGGHLAASLSTDHTIAQEFYDGDIDPHLTGAGLIYPVVSDKYSHGDSHDNLFKHAPEGYKEKYIPLTRMDSRVCQRTAPAYIFSTFGDSVVPSLNALKYAQAMAQNGIQYELHVYKNGDHGMSTGDCEVNFDNSGFSRNQAWVDDCAAFFRDFVKETV